MRSCLSENLEVIEPLSNSKLKLAPTGKYRRSIISALRDKNIIIFSPTTEPDSVIIEDGRISQYYPDGATFELNVISSKYEKITNNLLYLKNEFEISSEERISIWKEIALNECLEFLYPKLDEYNLPSDYIGEKTESSIKSALEEFSISQLYNFIWRAVKNAATFYQKEHILKKHAVNTIAGNISRSNEKSIVEGWDIKGYGRDYNYPQTVISEVFFNTILKIGEKGFSAVIG